MEPGCGTRGGVEFLREWIIFGVMVLFVIFGWAVGANKGPFKKKDEDDDEQLTDDQAVERARAEGRASGHHDPGGTPW
jgi:hypothetical protein